MQSGKTPANKADPIAIIQAKWSQTFGKKATPTDSPTGVPVSQQPVQPAGGAVLQSLDPTRR
jgi:hypothetical protein